MGRGGQADRVPLTESARARQAPFRTDIAERLPELWRAGEEGGH